MAAIEKILATLSDYPGVRFGRLANRLEVEPQGPDGFPVAFIEEARGYTLVLGRCRMHFEEERDALDHFAFALSPACRLREWSRGHPYRWIVEQKSGEGWSAIYETGTRLFPFWKRKRERIYRNAVFG
jgi:hypothetical protein